MSNASVINYEALLRDAMRGIVKDVLQEAADSGLPGDHHFYISFDTLAPGVVLSKRLREKYAEEMTIVLQHRFWDLAVADEQFEVKLTFDGIPERLVVPFKAIKVFFDPSVRYVLQFEVGDFSRSNSEPVTVLAHDEEGDAGQDNARPTGSEQSLAEGLSATGGGNTNQPADKASAQIIGKAEHQSAKRFERDTTLPSVNPEDDVPDQPDASAEIVSLDAFRKK
ncbi:MAG: SspB family protein [Hyphomicrobiaceae bacterium]